MKILITGASGYVGARIFADLLRHYDVVGTFQGHNLFEGLLKLDITNREDVFKIVSKTHPNLIIHAAAISSRRLCEERPQDAFAINTNGTKNIVSAANINNAGIIYISSLGVLEKPETVYGKTKLLGERYVVQNARIGYDVLRLSMSFGYSRNTDNDRPFNRIIKTLRKGEPIIYDNTWRFLPTYLGHVSATIKTLIEKRIRNKTITVTIPEPKSMYQIASDILKPFGRSVEPDNTGAEKVEVAPEVSDINLPACSYKMMIKAITQEIKDNVLAPFA